MKVIWNSSSTRPGFSVASGPIINGNLRSNLSALLNDELLIGLNEIEVDLLKHKLERLQWETEFIRRNRKRFLSLTKREIEVIEWLLKGYNNPEIAEALFISRRTVEQHRKNINRKLNIRSSLDLFIFSYAFNLV